MRFSSASIFMEPKYIQYVVRYYIVVRRSASFLYIFLTLYSDWEYNSDQVGLHQMIRDFLPDIFCIYEQRLAQEFYMYSQ
jgi:hypothetical protein